MYGRLILGCLAAAIAALSGCGGPTAVTSSVYRQAQLAFGPTVEAGSEPARVDPGAPVGTGPAASVPTSPAVPAVPAVPVVPGQSGGSGGSSGASGPGGAPLPSQVSGRVLGYSTEGRAPVPVAAATIWTTDGRRAVTDDTGRFSFEGGWPADGTWTVRHPSYRTSTIVGVTPSATLDLHLKTDAANAASPRASGTRSFPLTGRIVDATGATRAGVTLKLSAPDGSYGGPSVTGADGRFTMEVFSETDTVRNAVMLAVDYENQAWIGAKSGLTVIAGRGDLDFSPETGPVDPLVLAAAGHPVTIVPEGVDASLAARVYVEMSLGGLDGLALFGRQSTVPLADIPGVQYTVRVEATDPDRIRQSIYQDDLTVDWSAGQTTVQVPLLSPPTVHPLTESGPVDAVRWDPVAGATGYEVQLNSLTRRSALWEGFTQGTMIAVNVPDTPLTGAYAVQVAAWHAENMSTRHVASVPAVGARALRLLPLAGRYRVASTETRLEF